MAAQISVQFSILCWAALSLPAQAPFRDKPETGEPSIRAPYRRIWAPFLCLLFFPESLAHFLAAVVCLNCVLQVLRSERLQGFYWSFSHPMPHGLLLTFKLKAIETGNSFQVGPSLQCQLPSRDSSLSSILWSLLCFISFCSEFLVLCRQVSSSRCLLWHSRNRILFNLF